MEIKSDSRDDLLEIYPNKYIFTTHGEAYEYDLPFEKWDSLNSIVAKLDVKNLEKIEVPQGRFVEKNISHTIQFEMENNDLKIPTYYNGIAPENLIELHNFLNDFLPLN